MTETIPPAQPGSIAAPSERTHYVGHLSSHLQHLWWAALVLLGISASAVGWTIWELRSDAFKAAIAESGNIADGAGRPAVSIRPGHRCRADRDQALDQGPRHRYAAELSRRIQPPRHAGGPARAAQPAAAHLQHRDRGRARTGHGDRPPPGRRPTSTSPTATTSSDARMRTDGRLSTSVPIRNRIDGSRRSSSRGGWKAGRRIRRHHLCSVNSEYFEAIYGSTQSIHSHLHAAEGRDDPVPPSGCARLCGKEGLRGPRGTTRSRTTAAATALPRTRRRHELSCRSGPCRSIRSSSTSR